MESWLQNVGARGEKTAWVKDLFERVGATREDANYLRPGENDVWAFLDSIRNWVGDPSRNGMTVGGEPTRSIVGKDEDETGEL